MTVVEGVVERSKADAFEAAYAAVREEALPPGLVMSFLARDSTNPEQYRIITVWESREALERMRSSTQVPKAVALFKECGVDPKVTIFEIRERF